MERKIQTVKFFLLLLSMTLLTACNNQQLTSNYTFRYTVENFALGPVDGVKSYEVVVKDNKPVQVANTASGIMLSSVDKADGLNAIMKVISDKQNDYRVKYYKNGLDFLEWFQVHV